MAFRALGQQVRTAQRNLETFTCPESISEVVFETDEVTSLCPVTGQPDWYTVRIRYRPANLCVESKSLKLYFWTFREMGQFCEQFASRVLGDFVAACDPRACEVSVIMKSRGGISIEAVAEVGEW